MVRVNGKPILHQPGANYSAGPHLDRPVETTSHEADLTPYAGQHVIIEFSSDGGPVGSPTGGPPLGGPSIGA